MFRRNKHRHGRLGVILWLQRTSAAANISARYRNNRSEDFSGEARVNYEHGLTIGKRKCQRGHRADGERDL